jgi:preprotein translocase subunit YajC
MPCLPFEKATPSVYDYPFLYAMSTILLLFQDGGSTSLIVSLLPFVLIFGIFYVLVTLPQKKQRQQLQDLVTQLKINDEVVTNGGIIGKIKEVKETSFIIQSAEKSFLEVGKSAVVGKRAEITK